MLPGSFTYVFLGSVGRTALDGGSRAVIQVAAALATLAPTIVFTRIAGRAIREAGVEAESKSIVQPLKEAVPGPGRNLAGS